MVRKFCVTDRSSCPEAFCKKGVLRNFAKFTGKHPCQSLFLIKLQAGGLQFIKKDSGTGVFSVNFVKFLRTPFLQNTPERVLLDYQKDPEERERWFRIIPRNNLLDTATTAVCE